MEPNGQTIDSIALVRLISSQPNCPPIGADTINDKESLEWCADQQFAGVFTATQNANTLGVKPTFTVLGNAFADSYRSKRVDIYVKVNYNTNEQIYLNVPVTLQGACDVADGEADPCPSRFRECKPCEIKDTQLFDACSSASALKSIN